MATNDPVILTPYNDAWPRIFQIEADRLREALAPCSLQKIEHVGSTAIRGMVAKPIVDILAGVNNMTLLPAPEDPLWRSLGYEWGHGDENVDDWHYFIKRDDARRRFIHLHIVPYRGEFWTNTVLFRDALRSSPATAGKYVELKIRLAKRFSRDRLAYVAGKHDFVAAVVSEHRFAIREETIHDIDAIRSINQSAFARSDEGRLVDGLRDENLMVASLVALIGERPVGSAVFSELPIRTETRIIDAATLAPLAVTPEYQRRGIGAALVRDGVDLCKKRGKAAITVLGDPSYYSRFGFSAKAAERIEGPYSGRHWMALELSEGALRGIQGKVRYPQAFNKNALP